MHVWCLCTRSLQKLQLPFLCLCDMLPVFMPFGTLIYVLSSVNCLWVRSSTVKNSFLAMQHSRVELLNTQRSDIVKAPSGPEMHMFDLWYLQYHALNLPIMFMWQFDGMLDVYLVSFFKPRCGWLNRKRNLTRRSRRTCWTSTWESRRSIRTGIHMQLCSWHEVCRLIITTYIVIEAAVEVTVMIVY